MILVKPSVEILTMTQNPLQLIELAGRTCYKSESPLTEETAKEFSLKLTRDEHLSVIEHAVVTVRIVCDRGVTHEICRHRLCSYSQESTRFVDYTKATQGSQCHFIIPLWIHDLQAGHASVETDDAALATLNELNSDTSEWLYSMQQAENNYKRKRARGWSPQKARCDLPNSTKTEIVMTTNFRSWQHFFKLRAVSKKAHPQMREVAIPLLRMFQERVPVLFDHLVVDPMEGGKW